MTQSGPRLPVTALYVPASRPDRFDKAVGSGADVVILDLEDAVAPSDKDDARDNVVTWLAQRQRPATCAIQVRVNPAGTPWARRDLSSLPLDVEIRLPKVETPDDLVDAGAHPLHALIESARGVENAYEIAAHPSVATVALGEADLAADLAITAESALAWVRTRIVVAARAADLPAPMMSVYPRLQDLDGLAASCAVGRALGMRGRTAIHPDQLAVISAAFASTPDELAWACAVLAALDAAGGGVAMLSDGAMVDQAMARRARSLLDLG